MRVITKTIYQFESESEYLEWESRKGNTLYAIQGKDSYMGDIKESDLVNLLDKGAIINIEEPKNPSDKFIADTYFTGYCATYGVLPEFNNTALNLIVGIEYPK